MKKSFKFSLYSKSLFLISYFYHKITLFKDVKHGIARIYLAEIIWIINQLFKMELKLPNIFTPKYFVTKYGKFYVTNDLISTITVSPAFERRDIDYLLKLIKTKVKNKNKILFIDIGANFGLYTIIIGNKFKNKKVDILSFEPNTTYLTSPTYSLLKKNIQNNRIKNIKLYKIGIGSKNTSNINSASFATRTLDNVIGIKKLNQYDVVFMKLDVDDYVLDALKGIQDCVNNSKKVILLVEDFVDKRSIKYLNKNWNFIDKLSFYNSFWTNR